jgi:hypothetical protein
VFQHRLCASHLSHNIGERADSGQTFEIRWYSVLSGGCSGHGNNLAPLATPHRGLRQQQAASLAAV